MVFMRISVFLTSICLSLTPMVLSAHMPGTEEIEDVTINEDLMREHGILNRCLLIYEEIAKRIDEGRSFSSFALLNTALVIREYLENHHEKMEEQFIFPRLEEANVLTDITAILREQHKVGRGLTDYIIAAANPGNLALPNQKQKLSACLGYYVRMFRPHEAREGTVIFPAFKNLVTEEEYKEIGEECERIEHEHFGEGAFENMVMLIETIEKQLGIYQLDQFTSPEAPQ